MKLFFKIVIIVIFLVLLVFKGGVLAHRPLETKEIAPRSDPIQVSEHQISWAAYTRLAHKGEVDYYRFEVEKGDKIYASMSIPQIDRLKEFSPAFALIGPGLNNEIAGRDFRAVNKILDIKNDENVIIKKYSGGEPENFFEPFTQTRYWRKQELTVKAPQDGVYYLAVFSLKNKTGKYVFSIGKKEVWGIKDLAKMPKIWWEVRLFMENRISTYTITSLIGLLAIKGVMLIIK